MKRRTLQLARRMHAMLSFRVPNRPVLNYLLGAPHFLQRLRRLPLAPTHPDSEIADVLFDRMMHERWHDLHRECTDKITAKEHARRLAPELNVTRTEAVFDVHPAWTVAEIERRLRPYCGRALVAKPAHSCGGFVDLSLPLTDTALTALHKRAVADYFPVFRETQYRALPRRIIVEQRLGDDADVAADYKFHCAWGVAETVQIDVGRQRAGRRAMMQIDGWRWFHGGMGGQPFDAAPPRPRTWDRMLAIVALLSVPFDYVRVDLYEQAGEVYFGEFTFTPSAGTVITSSSAVRTCLNRAYRAGPTQAWFHESVHRGRHRPGTAHS